MRFRRRTNSPVQRAARETGCGLVDGKSPPCGFGNGCGEVISPMRSFGRTPRRRHGAVIDAAEDSPILRKGIDHGAVGRFGNHSRNPIRSFLPRPLKFGILRQPDSTGKPGEAEGTEADEQEFQRRSPEPSTVATKMVLRQSGQGESARWPWEKCLLQLLFILGRNRLKSTNLLRFLNNQ